ncbi:MerR family transcriptional regulator [Pectobacterium sp. CHL-2024]|uniref:MerR family transcriptional regulator n=2 Tax=Pectobacterium TaxID=122277 RepID=A0AA93DMB2_9GAMM|nr:MULTISPECIES: MerR family transcriptional regulator [Pectobacterium]PLY36399.1 helix-turn-helix-type transcriptional regulator [Pectobacterium carotovorum]GKV78717.1 helix-turn-helix-type transcriptional regulator [Pectobacterium carotovorum subsp. carotovorum]AFR02892.1 putative transcriptional regulator [Pectobacterium carotovorum subsp. carotovorum PCC21]KFF63192.1 MerR family transcriptional regulator [Pectobacterium brasiliense]KHS67965.1 MerR family transcriptional regulator [Pectobac
MSYSIGEFSRLCGINATTLRAWQRRYGLLKPMRTDGGHRLYSDDDVQQALKILDWVKKGVPVSQVKPLLARPGTRRTNNWLALQESMLQRLKEGKIESLRQLIYDAGREYPRTELVREVLRPLRSKVSANIPAMMTLREILDGIIISYTSFCLEGDKRAPGDNYLITGWHLSDPCEIWLEALMRTGQGLRIDVLPVPPATLAPEIFPERKWLLVTTGKLTAARKKQIDLWQQHVASLDVIPL